MTVEAARTEARRRRLDLRRVYAFIDGDLHVLVRWVSNCSGCACQMHDCMCSCPSGGCRECGYTGKRRRREHAPADHAGPFSKWRGVTRYDDFRRIKEVDQDLTFRDYLSRYAGKDGRA